MKYSSKCRRNSEHGRNDVTLHVPAAEVLLALIIGHTPAVTLFLVCSEGDQNFVVRSPLKINRQDTYVAIEFEDDTGRKKCPGCLIPHLCLPEHHMSGFASPPATLGRKFLRADGPW